MICLLFALLPAFAADPQWTSELERLRDLYWERVVSEDWQFAHPDHVIRSNAYMSDTVRATVGVLERMFGTSEALAGLGSLPRSHSENLTLIEQRRSLKRQFDQIDTELRRAQKPYDPDWRNSPIGREILNLSLSLMNTQRYDRGINGVRALIQRKWIPEAQTVARLAPYAKMDVLLARAGEHLEDAPALAQAIADVLFLLRKIEAQLDRGWDRCGVQLEMELLKLGFEK